MKAKVADELKQHFRPEFLNRVDEIVVFRQLTQEDIERIVDLMVAQIEIRLKDKDMGIELTPAAKTLIAKRGFDPVLGARPLRRALQRDIEDYLAEKILFSEVKSGEIVVVDVADPGSENAVHLHRESALGRSGRAAGGVRRHRRRLRRDQRAGERLATQRVTSDDPGRLGVRGCLLAGQNRVCGQASLRSASAARFAASACSVLPAAIVSSSSVMMPASSPTRPLIACTVSASPGSGSVSSWCSATRTTSSSGSRALAWSTHSRATSSALRVHHRVRGVRDLPHLRLGQQVRDLLRPRRAGTARPRSPAITRVFAVILGRVSSIR